MTYEEAMDLLKRAKANSALRNAIWHGVADALEEFAGKPDGDIGIMIDQAVVDISEAIDRHAWCRVID